MHPYDSLRQKLVQPFLLLGFIVSAVLSLVTFALLAQIEERAIARMLHAELESFQKRHALDPQAMPAESRLLRGKFLPDRLLPSFPDLTPGAELLLIKSLDDNDYSVLYAHVGGRPFALIYDRSYIKSNLANLALMLLIATGVMTLLSFLVGYRLSRRVAQPIARLLNDVSAKAELRTPPADPVAFDDADYPDDEIGSLVKALDRFSERLCEFARRESYFAADVSHELRTPVAVIAGAAEVLGEMPGLNDPMRRRVETIFRNASRMSQILEAMLLLGKEESLDADPSCSLNSVILDAVADCTPSLEGRPVRIEAGQLMPVTLPVERTLVYVLVSNVLRNACAHTREGSITITLTHERLSISDTGIGMAEERLAEMFSRYAKGEHSPGHGIGLSIVARVCERLRWAIAVHSTAGQGTTFSFTFPQQESPQA